VLTRLSVLASRISGAFNGRALDQDFDREVESHLAMMADDYRRRGMSEEEARRTARLRFGGPTQTREDQDGMDKPARPEVYVPFAANAQNPATFVVRSDVDATPMVAAARQTVRAIDRDLLLTEVTTLDGLVRDSMSDERFRATMLSGFAGVALFLAVLGIYGVLAYFVSQRSRELGIRVALGARPRALFAMVVGQGMRPVAIGSAAGLAGAIALTGLMESLLFGVTPLDPITYASSIGVLAASALGACALPALRAARVDPLIAIREE